MTFTKKLAGAVLLAGAMAACFAADSDIRINSIGFHPDYPKKASVKVSAGGIMALGDFSVKDAATNEVVFSDGTIGAIIRNTDTGDTTRVADFSAFKTPGKYYIDIPGVGRSPEFEIGPNVFTAPYRVMMLGMYLWRCGTAVHAEYNGKTYEHAACHLSDGNLQYIGGGGTRDGTQGWHDAGDYNKYVVNSGVTVGLMLKAWEHYGEVLNGIDLMVINKEGNIPEYLTEVKWNLDWVAKMQYDDGKVSHKMSTRNFCGEILPENETAVRYFVPWGTPATGSFVGMLAQAARVYEPYDKTFADSCLAKAKRSYDVLASNASAVSPDQSAFSTGTYTQTGDTDKRLWAAVEMWETTGEVKYLNDFESRASASNLGTDLGWADVGTMACLTYLSSSKTGRKQSLVDALRTKLLANADGFVTNTRNHGYGRVFGTASYYWGAHGALTATSYSLNTAYALTKDQKYREAGHEVLSHVFGRNYYGRSFVTGLGHNPPQNPHDRRSEATHTPWPGYLIGGPHNDKTSPDLAPYRCTGGTGAAATCWKDEHGDYSTNEIAINWNGSMIYALAAYLEPHDPTGVIAGRAVSARPVTPAIKTTRVVQFKNGRSGTVIPPGAKIYSLDGRLVAHRKAGDANMPSINRNGVFIMKTENQPGRK